MRDRSEEHVHFLADEIAKVGAPFVFKASFDKANRSSVTFYRGPRVEGRGADPGEMRSATGLSGVDRTFIEAAQADVVAEAVDILQIPAFLCRQTDLLVAAGARAKIVNIKKRAVCVALRYSACAG